MRVTCESQTPMLEIYKFLVALHQVGIPSTITTRCGHCEQDTTFDNKTQMVPISSIYLALDAISKPVDYFVDPVEAYESGSSVVSAAEVAQINKIFQDTISQSAQDIEPTDGVDE